MSYTVKIAVKKLMEVLENLPECGHDFSGISEAIDLLKDPKILLLEWSEEDFQMIARRDLAYENDLEEEELVKNPLSEEKIINIIDYLEHYYDCNQGISWDDISSAIKEIGWPDIKDCLIKK